MFTMRDMNASPPHPDSPRLLVETISKRFPGVQALNRVSLRVEPGEVLALIGENGAGKSTLMKILAGIVSPDEGRLEFEGQPVRFDSPAEAISRGVALIHQELNLAENLTIAENVMLGREPRRLGFLQRGEMRRQTAEVLARVGLDADPDWPVERLPVAGQQLVEIAKAVSADAKLVIMDEPTSSLSARETERLFEVVGDLKRAGVSIVYISHRLAEVIKLADRVEVLRDGRNAGTLEGPQITHDAMVNRMIGRDLNQFFARHLHGDGTASGAGLEVGDLVTETAPRHAIRFQVRPGEVVALAGLVGAGRSELVETIFGVRRPLSGTVSIDNRPLVPGKVAENIRRGIGLVTEDRKLTGLLLDSSVQENITLAALKQSPAAPFISNRWEAATARSFAERLRVRAASTQTPVVTLSGGNQQKVALGKWLACRPKVLILDEPTRGVDIGAKHEIYEHIERLTAEGLAVLVVSSEMEEVLGLADRTLVMYEGRLVGELERESMSEQAIMELALGPPESRS